MPNALHSSPRRRHTPHLKKDDNSMSVTILIGAQWGDEGKGRFVDWLAADAQIVARYSGGDNAGHTVADGEHVYKLHLIPSGVLRQGVVSVMGNGMVVNPISLLREIDELIALGVNITPDNLLLSNRAHIITPSHIARDKASEKARGDDAIPGGFSGAAVRPMPYRVGPRVP